MPRHLRWLLPVNPMFAGPLPNAFFFGVLAVEEPFDHIQRNILREAETTHPIVGRVMAIHVAEEARHISFADGYLRKRLPGLAWWKRLLLSLYIPVIMRLLGLAVVVPPKAFWREFGIPRKVRKQVFFRAPESRRLLRDMFADVRMLCDVTGLMNWAARLMWRMCRIDGEPSRYRSEPRRGGRRPSGLSDVA